MHLHRLGIFDYILKPDLEWHRNDLVRKTAWLERLRGLGVRFDGSRYAKFATEHLTVDASGIESGAQRR